MLIHFFVLLTVAFFYLASYTHTLSLTFPLPKKKPACTNQGEVWQRC